MIIEKIKYVGLLIGLFQIAKIDWQSRRIPNQYLKRLLLCRGVLFIIEETILGRQLYVQNLLSMLSGTFCGGGVMFLCYSLTRGKLGAGDVKLFAVIGMYMGDESILRIMTFSFIMAFFFCTIEFFLGETDLKKQISFAPFVFIGTVLEMIFY